MAYNTGNPLGSTDPRDLSDNSENLDRALNSDSRTWRNRLGQERPTLRAGEIASQEVVDTAEHAKAGISLEVANVRQNAQQADSDFRAEVDGLRGNIDERLNGILVAGGRIFDSEEQGRAAVEDGQYYYAASDNPGVSKSMWQRINSSSSRFIADDPSAQLVADTLGESILAQDLASSPNPAPGEFHSGTDETIPLFLDEQGLVLLGVDAQGFLSTKLGGEFHTGEAYLYDYALINELGGIVWGSMEGTPVTPWSGEFYSDDEQPSLALCDINGAAFLQWGEDGKLVGSSDFQRIAQPSIPYQVNGQVRAVDHDDFLLAETGDLAIRGLSPSARLSARAIVDFPWANQPLTCSIGGGMLVPDNERTLFGFVGLGQSLMVGSTSAESLVSLETQFPEHVLMFESSGFSDVRIGVPTSGDQPVLTADHMTGFTPLVAKRGLGGGARGETPMEAHANTLQYLAAGIDTEFRSLSFTAAQGGTPYSQLKKGTQLYDNLLTAVARAKALAEQQGWRFVMAGALVKHGEADASSTAYYDDILQWQQDVDGDIKAITGQSIDVHFFYTQPSSFYVTSAPGAAARAMLDAHNTSPYHHVAGPDYPYQDEYSPDLVHMTGPGYYHIGEKIALMWAKGLWNHRSKASVLQMMSARREGVDVIVEMDVPVPPLVLDDSIGVAIAHAGFRYEVDGQFVDVASLEIVDASTGQVKLRLSEEPGTGSEAVHYATDGHSGERQESTIPRGNLRDSNQQISSLGQRPMYNWACHQIIDVEIDA